MSARMTDILGIVMIAAAAAAVMRASWPAAEVSQPLSFPHSRHVDLNMSCVSCHTGAGGSQQAGIPSVQFCALCHQPNSEFPPTPAELAGFISSNEEIPWRQVNRLPRHLQFSHRDHVSAAGLECETCHGQVSLATESIARSHFAGGMEGMMRCVACHRREGASTDCLSCHH